MCVVIVSCFYCFHVLLCFVCVAYMCCCCVGVPKCFVCMSYVYVVCVCVVCFLCVCRLRVCLLCVAYVCCVCSVTRADKNVTKDGWSNHDKSRRHKSTSEATKGFVQGCLPRLARLSASLKASLANRLPGDE